MVPFPFHSAAAILLLFAPAEPVTIEEVQQHDSSLDCWSAIYGKVYEFTNYGESHTFGGGPQRVWDSCGKDFTDDFDAVHGDSPQYLQWAGIIEIGDLEELTPPPTEATTSAPQTPEPTTPEPTPGTLPPEPTTSEPVATTPVPTPVTTAVPQTPEPTTPEPTPGTLPPEPTTSEPVATTPVPTQVTTSLPPEPTQDQTQDQGNGTTTIPPTTPATTMTPPNTTETTPATTPEPTTSAATEPETKPGITLEQLADHNTPDDCLILFYDNVYNVTEYAYRHPVVGEAAIHPYCGANGTDAFAGVHNKTYLDRIEDLIAGPLELGITLEKLADHDSPEDCWVLFYDQVYNLTEYAYRHPVVGEAAIHPYCGANGTDAFAGAHNKTYLDRIKDLNVGPVTPNAPTEPPASEIVISDEELAEHDSPEDCWVAFYGSAYDMTAYAYSHPGPAEAAIHPWCGLDGTTAFDIFHEESLLSKVEYTKIGTLSTSAASATGALLVAAVYSATAMFVLA